MRSVGLISLPCLLLALAAVFAHAATGPAGKPNVLLILADDLRASSLRSLGNNEIETPNLDRLVPNGTAFTNTYLMGALVAPVCQPSRAMLLTGRNVFEQRRHGAEIPASVTTLPEAFHAAGYETFIAGKWHNDRASLFRIFQKGGPIFGNPKPSHWDYPVVDFRSRRETRHQGVHTTKLMTDAAIEFLKNRNREQPFFAYLPYSAPHAPWEAPWTYLAQYPPDKILLPPNFRSQHPFDNGELGLGGRTTETKYIGLPRDPAEVRELIASYHAMIAHLDAEIGRLLNTLQQLGMAEHTVVVFTGDNGLSLGQQGLISKQNIYEAAAAVPLVFYGPGVPRGVRHESLAYIHDVYPTLCDLAGIAVPPGVTAKNLVPVMRGQQGAVRPRLLLAYKNFMRALREGDWKLHVYNVNSRQTVLLFNLRTDPWEMSNLAADPAHAPRMRQMMAALQQEITAAGDPVRLDAPGWGVPVIPQSPDDVEYWRGIESN